MSRYFLTPWELHNMLIEINYLTQFPVNIDKIPDKKLKIEIENTLKTKNNKKSIIGIHSVFSFSLYWNIEQNLCFFFNSTLLQEVMLWQLKLLHE